MTLSERKKQHLVLKNQQVQQNKVKLNLYSPRNEKFFGYAQFPSPKHQQQINEIKKDFQQNHEIIPRDIVSNKEKTLKVVREQIDHMQKTYCQFLSQRSQRPVTVNVRKRLQQRPNELRLNAKCFAQTSNSRNEHKDYSSYSPNKNYQDSFNSSFNETTFQRFKKTYQANNASIIESERSSNQPMTMRTQDHLKNINSITSRDSQMNNSIEQSFIMTTRQSMLNNSYIQGYDSIKAKYLRTRVNPFLRNSAMQASEESETKPDEISPSTIFDIKTGQNFNKIFNREKSLEQFLEEQLTNKEKLEKIRTKGRFQVKVLSNMEQFAKEIGWMKKANMSYFDKLKQRDVLDMQQLQNAKIQHKKEEARKYALQQN